MSTSFDYIVIGAGSAGCVLADRLSADANVSVLLLEAGGDNSAYFIEMPSGYGKVIGDPRYDWCYDGGPEPHLHGREVFMPRGKGLGGSSAINGMAYLRGHPADFNHWRQLGNEGWSWQDVLQTYSKVENYDCPDAPERFTSGKMRVSTLEPHSLSERIIEAAGQAGLPTHADYNRRGEEGIGLLQMNAWKGQRFSSKAAYLEPAMGRPNLTVRTGCHVDRIVLVDGAARGVLVRAKSGETEKIAAHGEVILAAGSIASPKLLELSGIGASDLLTSLGIPVKHELRGVGENLQDHLGLGIQMKLEGLRSLNEEMRGLRLAMHGLRFALTRTGLFANSPAQVTGYATVMGNAVSPDLQLWGIPGTIIEKSGSRGENKMAMDTLPGVTLACNQNRPESRGHTHAASPDSAAPPRIINNYLDHPLDREVAVRGLRLCRRILEQPAFDGFRASPAGPDEAFASDEGVLEYARAAGRSSYHLVGTCRMGSGTDAVVDSRLRVHGLRRLRVIDSSIMPTIVSGNTHAATVMIAEKGAQMVLEDRPNLAGAEKLSA